MRGEALGVQYGQAARAIIHGEDVTVYRSGVDDWGWIAVIPHEGTVRIHTRDVEIIEVLS